MNSNICKNCDNFMFTYTDADKNLFNYCKKCGNKNKIDEKCIYKTTYDLNLGEILNKNTNILNDQTLPIIKNNINIKCPNDECVSNIKKKSSNVKYLKYDIKNMKYIYICNHCKQSWTNL